VETPSRITAIEHDPRRPGTVRLELDGTRFGVVPADLIAAEGLSPGQTIAPAVHERLSRLALGPLGERARLPPGTAPSAPAAAPLPAG